MRKKFKVKKKDGDKEVEDCQEVLPTWEGNHAGRQWSWLQEANALCQSSQTQPLNCGIWCTDLKIGLDVFIWELETSFNLAPWWSLEQAKFFIFSYESTESSTWVKVDCIVRRPWITITIWSNYVLINKSWNCCKFSSSRIIIDRVLIIDNVKFDSDNSDFENFKEPKTSLKTGLA